MHRSMPQAPQHAVTCSVPGLSGVQIGSLFRWVLESEALEREVHAAHGCQLRRLVRIFWKTFENSHCPSLASEDPAWRRPGPGLTSTPLRTQVPCSAPCPRLGLAEVREPRGACALGPGCRPRKFRNDVVDPLAWSRGDGWPLSGTERPECHL